MTGRTLIHVVDDEATVRRAIGRLLRAHGYLVRTFASVDEFLTASGADAAACAIVDLRMPGKTGVDLLNILGASRIVLPVILITGHGDLPTVANAIGTGARQVLLKPVDDTTLLSAIRRAVSEGPSVPEI